MSRGSISSIQPFDSRKLTPWTELPIGSKDMVGKGRTTNGMSRVWGRPEEDRPLRSFPLEKGYKAEPPIFIIIAKLVI